MDGDQTSPAPLDMAREHLTWLYGDNPAGYIWIGGHADGWRGRCFLNVDAAVDYAMHLDALSAGGVYHRLTTLRRIPEQGRGATEDSATLPAFAMDLDLAGPGHKEAKLPRPATFDDLRRLLAAAEVPQPDRWVCSGGGYYPFWKIAPAANVSPESLSAHTARAVSEALHSHVIRTAAAMGWKIDNTQDLARVYRLPGTTNRKSEPVLCQVIA